MTLSYWASQISWLTEKASAVITKIDGNPWPASSIGHSTHVRLLSLFVGQESVEHSAGRSDKVTSC